MIHQTTTNPLAQSISLENSFILMSIFPQSEIVLKEINGESSVYLLPQNLVGYLEAEYIFKNPDDIKVFLIANEELIEILFSAPQYIHKIFGDVPVYLELHHDPEEEWEELFIIIKTDYSPEKAVELEDRLYEEWFVKVLDKVKGKLNFTEEPL